MATEAVTHVLSSPLVRALAAAEAVAATCAIDEVHVWPELREGFSGVHRGLARSQLQAQFPRVLLAETITEESWRPGDGDYDALWLRCQEVVAREQLVPAPGAERPNWPLYPPAAVEVKAVKDVGHLTDSSD